MSDSNLMNNSIVVFHTRYRKSTNTKKGGTFVRPLSIL